MACWPPHFGLERPVNPSARRASRRAACSTPLILRRYADTQAGLLPFGIQKRVDIARALAAEPKLLLLDEPVSGMSEAEAEAAVTTMRTLAREHGITLVVVEHNMRVLMNLAERVTVLNQGRLLATGTPAEMQANTAVIEAYLGDAA